MIFVGICLTGNHGAAQDLLPDSNFEKLVDPNCLQPDDYFSQLEHWYTLNGSPDLFRSSCSFDDSGLFFWDKSIGPYTGEAFVGLSSRWNSNETYVSEGIATRLRQPLIADQVYFIEVALMNRGFFEGLSNDFSPCKLEPDKHLDLFISQDSIKVINDFSNGTASVIGDLVGTFSGQSLLSNEPGDWMIVSSCFRAKGGEEYFGITMPQGTFGTLPPCAANLSTGVFQTFYYNLDQVRISTIPDSFSEAINICQDEIFELDLTQILDPIVFENASFVWADGLDGLARSFTNSGEYNLNIISDCGQFQLNLQVDARPCDVSIYIPNAFSPNGDGINDSFGPSIGELDKLSNYQLQVFDRWGNQVFFSNDPAQSWKGNFTGKALEPGIYLWVLQYEVNNLQELHQYNSSGSVMLLK